MAVGLYAIRGVEILQKRPCLVIRRQIVKSAEGVKL